MKCQMRSSFVRYLLTITVILMIKCVPKVVSMCPRGCLCDDIKLTTICGSESDLFYVPHTLNPALKQLFLYDNQIRGIKSSLSVYRNLQLLDISRNQLSSLDENNFIDNTRIETLVLKTNQLISLENNTFNGLTSLKRMYLNDNKLEELNTTSFRPLNSLQTLDLSKNRIKYISVDAFRGLQSLIELNLHSNQLNTIPTDCLRFVPNLHVLDFGSNLLINISNDAFHYLSSLSELFLDNCSLIGLEDHSFRGLNRLSILRLTNNHLMEIPSKCFKELSLLEELQIGKNYFTTITAKAFSHLKHLKTLEINKTQTLSSIELGAFDEMSNLERLELSGNRLLTNIDNNVLSDIPNVRYFSLRSNGFISLQLDFVNKFDRKIFLDVRDNPFHCNCSLEWLQNYLLEINTSKQMFNNSSEQISYPFYDLLVSVSRVECQSPPSLASKLLIDLKKDEFGCFQLDTEIPIIIAIMIGVLLISGVIIIFVIRCKYGLSGIVKNQWFSNENTSNSNCLPNDLNYRKPEFVFIPNIDLNIEESNRALEEAVRYPLKMTPITEL